MAKKKHVLVIDDEPEILQLVEYHLLKAGYACTCAATGHDGLAHAKSLLPDLVLLDLMLPGVDGLQVCGLLKSHLKTRDMPIVMLTAKGAESDIVRGLEAGADDYVTKPFSPKVLLARIGAVLRRQPKNLQDESPVLHIHDLSIHPGRHEAVVKGRPLDLTHTEFGILHFLAQRPGWVFTRAQIVDALHGPGYPVTDRVVDVQIVAIRKKLGDCSAYIETVRGVGYRFRE